jgi:hypothetical protein
MPGWKPSSREAGRDDQRGQHQTNDDEARLELAARDVPQTHLEHCPVRDQDVGHAGDADGEHRHENHHERLHGQSE